VITTDLPARDVLNSASPDLCFTQNRSLFHQCAEFYSLTSFERLSAIS